MPLNPASKADIVEGLLVLEQKGQVKDCQHLHLSFNGHYYRSECDKKWARFEATGEVAKMETPYSSYKFAYEWPRCPQGCIDYHKSLDFKRTVSRDQYDSDQMSQTTPPYFPLPGAPPSVGPPPSEPTPILKLLNNFLARAEGFAAKPTVTRDALQMLTSSLRLQLDKIYGKTGPHQTYFASLPAQLSSDETRALAIKRVAQIKTLIATLEGLAVSVGERVFIGHGRSPLWRELKDFIQDSLHLRWDEFNREPVAGQTTSERLDQMLAQAGFAFLVMTAEEERLDATIHARDNVIHELGLFQGKLSRARAIILLEDGCAEFSNIGGLSQIRFPKGDISARFEHVRRVLVREGFLP